MVRLARFVGALAVLAGSLVLTTAGSAAACSCGEISDAEAFELADAVFIGSPVRIHEARDGGNGFSVTVLRVSDVFKGEVVELQAVAANERSTCRFTFQGDEPHIVFARSDSDLGELEDGIYYAASCSGTRVIGDSGVDLSTSPSAPRSGEIDTDTIANQLGDPRSSLFPEAFIFVGVLVFVISLVAWLNRTGRTVT